MKYPSISFSRWFDTHEVAAGLTKHIERDDHEIIETTFSLHFTTKNGGYSFSCDSMGKVDVESLNECARPNYEKAIAQEWESIEVMAFSVVTRLCNCGSGLPSHSNSDARGIYLCRTCKSCHAEKMSRYRPCVLSGYDESDMDEPIEPEEY